MAVRRVTVSSISSSVVRGLIVQKRSTGRAFSTVDVAGARQTQLARINDTAQVTGVYIDALRVRRRQPLPRQ